MDEQKQYSIKFFSAEGSIRTRTSTCCEREILNHHAFLDILPVSIVKIGINYIATKKTALFDGDPVNEYATLTFSKRKRIELYGNVYQLPKCIAKKMIVVRPSAMYSKSIDDTSKGDSNISIQQTFDKMITKYKKTRETYKQSPYARGQQRKLLRDSLVESWEDIFFFVYENPNFLYNLPICKELIFCIRK